MRRSLWHVIFFWSAVFFSQPTWAETSKAPGWLGKAEEFLQADLYRLSLGSGNAILRNPTGFDVPSSIFFDGFTNFGADTGSISFTGERRRGKKGKQKTLWNLHFVTNDHSGLKLNTLNFSYGLAYDPRLAKGSGFRAAAGIGGGITQSATFFDSALHPSVEAWVNLGIQLWHFTLDLNFREQKAFGATLDERTAAPRTSIVLLQFGFVF